MRVSSVGARAVNGLGKGQKSVNGWTRTMRGVFVGSYPQVLTGYNTSCF